VIRKNWWGVCGGLNRTKGKRTGTVGPELRTGGDVTKSKGGGRADR